MWKEAAPLVEERRAVAYPTIVCISTVCAFLEPFAHSWSCFVGIYRQKVIKHFTKTCD